MILAYRQTADDACRRLETEGWTVLVCCHTNSGYVSLSRKGARRWRVEGLVHGDDGRTETTTRTLEDARALYALHYARMSRAADRAVDALCGRSPR